MPAITPTPTPSSPRTGGGLRRGALGVLVALATGVSLLVLSMGSALAAEPAAGKLKSMQKAVGWSGSVAPTGASAGEIPECASTACDRFDLDVDLPRSVWRAKTGGVEVSIRWSSFGDNLRLYVYRKGSGSPTRTASPRRSRCSSRRRPTATTHLAVRPAPRTTPSATRP